MVGSGVFAAGAEADDILLGAVSPIYGIGATLGAGADVLAGVGVDAGGCD